jgi:hypothetical protein
LTVVVSVIEVAIGANELLEQLFLLALFLDLLVLALLEHNDNYSILFIACNDIILMQFTLLRVLIGRRDTDLTGKQGSFG